MKRIFLIFVLCLLPVVAKAQSMLLDAESMDYLKGLATPFLQAADIPVESANVFIIDDPQVNAFVTPERRIYFYTGLIEKAENPNQLQGVLAHEIGHIKGRHHLKALAMQDKLKWPTIIGTIIGVGAVAAAGGDADVGTAVMTGSMAASVSNILKFSRGQEQQADQIGLQLLNKAHTSPLGLAQFFDKLQVESTLFARTPPAYLLTHPMPSARMDFIKQYLPTAAADIPSGDTERFNRVKAKIMAFTDRPGQTLRKYMQDTSDTALYAKCIAYALQGKKKESISLINQLLKKSPDDFYYQELKAQLLVDHGDVKEAIDIYSKIVKEREDLPLVQLQYADALTAVDRAAEAVPYYNRVVRAFPEWASIHYRLGIAYGKAGEMAASHISLTQEAILDKKLDEAQIHLNTAEKYLDKANEATKQRFAMLKDALAEAKEE